MEIDSSATLATMATPVMIVGVRRVKPADCFM